MNNPISIEQYSSKSRLSELRVNSKFIFWLDADLDNNARQFLTVYFPDLPSDNRLKLTDSSNYNIKSAINEYGGASYWLGEHRLFFYNKDDNGIYVIDLDILPNILYVNFLDGTKPDLPFINYNYSDGIVIDNNFIAVREVISTDFSSHQELIYYNSDSKQLFILDNEHDFYSFLRFNSSTNQLLWISREHPNMPWDYNQLYCADLDMTHFKLINKKKLIDIPHNSLFQPEWVDNNSLLIVSEHDVKSPFWNLYKFDISNKKLTTVIKGEFEMGLPAWQLGSNSYCLVKNKGSSTLEWSFYYYRIFNGKYSIHHKIISNNLDVVNQSIVEKKLSSQVVYIQDNIFQLNNNLYYIASTQDIDLAVYQYNLSTDQEKILYSENNNINFNNAVSYAELINFTNEFGQRSYAYFYQPIDTIKTNKKPPLIVMCHSGPTGSTNIGYSNKIQFWTSRGYSVVDVNYSGSTSYGREYRERLKNNWGIIDVADCAAAAEYLVHRNKVDKAKIIIRGSSAGGFTVLTALYKYNIFTAGCCYYPVSDLTDFANSTHNFEKYYNNFLIGDYEQHRDEYIKRSPITFAEKITKPILIIHGTDDRVIPIEQSKKLFNKLKSNNKLNQFSALAGEGHGFRSYSALKKAIELELNLYDNLN